MAATLLDLGWSKARILDEAARLEGHPDNVAACVLGSVVFSAVEPGGITRAIRLDLPPNFRVAVVVPNFALPTREARAVLPDSYSRLDATFNIQRVALLTAALATGDASVFPTALDDRLHQPFRAQLVPGLAEILRLRAPGLLGCTLSGAGPGVLVFYERGYERVCELVRQTFAMSGCTTEIISSGVAQTGYELGGGAGGGGGGGGGGGWVVALPAFLLGGLGLGGGWRVVVCFLWGVGGGLCRLGGFGAVWGGVGGGGGGWGALARLGGFGGVG